MYRTAAVQAWVGARLPKLPRRAQYVAPLALASLAACGQGFLDGLRGQALIEFALAQAGQIGAMAIGIWHIGKRVSSDGLPLAVAPTEKPAD